MRAYEWRCARGRCAAKEEEDLADIDDKPTPSDVLAADILLQDEGGDEAFL